MGLVLIFSTFYFRYFRQINHLFLEVIMDKKAYVLIKNFREEDKTQISNKVAQLLGGYFTGDIRHGYNPDYLEVYFSPKMPSQEAIELYENKIEPFIRETFGVNVFVSLEIS